MQDKRCSSKLTSEERSH